MTSRYRKQLLAELETPPLGHLVLQVLLLGSIAGLILIPDAMTQKLGLNKAKEGVSSAIKSVKSAPSRAASSVRSRLPGWVPGSTATSAIVKNPNMRAALDTIARAEGTWRYPNSGYNTLVGGGQVTDLSRHPNRCIPFGNRGQCSTAFGRYQGLNKTWWGTMGNAAPTPENQDRFAIKLLRQCGVIDRILAGDPSWVDSGCVGGTWASFWNNGYGQKRYPSPVLRGWFRYFQQQNKR